MQALLEKSTLLNQFDPDEREEVTATLTEQYNNIYQSYSSGGTPSQDLMEKVIDMYLYLGVEPSAKLLGDLLSFLLEGITFSKLDIYMHLPEYEQIVKFLRPEYYAKINPRSVYVFTASEKIYNLAKERYLVEKTFKNAFSPWFINEVLWDGGRLTEEDLLYYIKHKRWNCARYVLKISQIKIECNDIVAEAIDDRDMDMIKFLLQETDMYEAIVLRILRSDFDEAKEYLAPLYKDAQCASLWEFIDYKDLNGLSYAMCICPKYKYGYMLAIIQGGWSEGLDFIDKNYGITIEDLHVALEEGSDSMIKQLYKILTKTYGVRGVLFNVLNRVGSRGCEELCSVVKVSMRDYITISDLRTSDYAILDNFTISKEDVLNVIGRPYDKDKDAMYDRVIQAYGKMERCFVEKALKCNYTYFLQTLKDPTYTTEVLWSMAKQRGCCSAVSYLSGLLSLDDVDSDSAHHKSMDSDDDMPVKPIKTQRKIFSLDEDSDDLYGPKPKKSKKFSSYWDSDDEEAYRPKKTKKYLYSSDDEEAYRPKPKKKKAVKDSDSEA